MKRLIKVMIVLSILMFAFSCGAESTGGSGGSGGGSGGGGGSDKIVYSDPWDGTTDEIIPEGNIYEINKSSELAWLATQRNENFAGKTVKFMSNIDMGSKAFGGIKNFGGIMDGNGKRIKNLTINGAATGFIVGFIFTLETAGTVKNLTIESGSIKGQIGNGYVGGIVGHNNGTITGVTNKATVESTAANATVGGIAGHSMTTIKGVENFGNITTATDGYAGGIVGSADRYAIIIDAKNSGNITATTGHAGGIIGLSNVAITIKNAGNSGILTATTVGGIIANSADVTIDYAYNYIKNSKMVGDNTISATINNSYSLADTTGTGTLSDNDFQNKSKFLGWDFNNIWEMDSTKGYPVLQ